MFKSDGNFLSTRWARHLSLVLCALFACIPLTVCAEWITNTRLTINPRSTDSFVISGVVSPALIASSSSIEIQLGNFSEVIQKIDFEVRKGGLLLVYRGQADGSGLSSVTLNLRNGKIVVKARRIILAEIGRPVAISLTLDEQKLCSVVGLKEKGKKSKGKKRKTRKQLVRAGTIRNCISSLSPILSQSALVKGSDDQILVELNLDGSAPPGRLEVFAANKQGAPIGKSLVELLDDGSVSSGDALAEDGVYSGFLSVPANKLGTNRYVVSSSSSLRRREPSAGSSGFEVQVLNELKNPTSFLEEFSAAQAEAGRIWQESKAKHGDTFKARVETVKAIRRIRAVLDAFISANQQDIDIQYENGVLGGLILSVRPDSFGSNLLKQSQHLINAPQTRQGAGSKVLIWDPGFFPETSESVSLFELFSISKDPEFQVTFLQGEQATIQSLESLTSFDIVVFVSHGFAQRDGSTGISTGQLITRELFAEYKKEFQTGKLKGSYNEQTGDGTDVGILPGFIRSLSGSFNNSIVYAGACHSSQSSPLPNAFRAKGAAAYLGYSERVETSFARDKSLSLFCNLLVEGDDLGRAYSNVTPKIVPLSLAPGGIERTRAQFTLDGSRAVSIAGTNPFEAKDGLTINPSPLELFPGINGDIASGLAENVRGLPCLEYRWTNPGKVGRLSIGSDIDIGTTEWLSSGSGRFFSHPLEELGENRSDTVKLDIRTKTDRREIGSAESEIKIICANLERAELSATATKVKPTERVLITAEPIGEILESCKFDYEWSFETKGFSGDCGTLSDGNKTITGSLDRITTSSNSVTLDPADCADRQDNPTIEVEVELLPQRGQGNFSRVNGKIQIEVETECLECQGNSAGQSFLRSANASSCQLQESCCEDNEDNDLDGLVDCDDPDCADKEICQCQPGEHPASIQIRSGSIAPCGCYAYAFIQWNQNLSVGASSVTAVYDWTGGGPLERTASASEPYDNAYEIAGADNLATATGTNWIYATGGSGVDFNTDRCAPDCEPALNALNTFMQNPRVRINCN